MNIKRRRSKWKSTVVTSRRKPQETNGNENNLESKKSSLSIFLFLVFLLFFPFFTICCFFHHRQKRSKGEEQKAIFRQVENDKRRKELAYYLRSQNEKVKTHQFFLPSIPVSYFFYFLFFIFRKHHKPQAHVPVKPVWMGTRIWHPPPPRATSTSPLLGATVINGKYSYPQLKAIVHLYRYLIRIKVVNGTVQQREAKARDLCGVGQISNTNPCMIII